MADQKQKRTVYGIDFDATLARYDQGDIEKHGPEYLGEPIPEAIAKVKAWMAQGIEVFIFTARVNAFTDAFDDQLGASEAYGLILDWCEKNIGTRLPVTHEKLRCFSKIIDDRGEQMIPNTGVFVTELMDSLGSDSKLNPAAAARTDG
jgi:hypothetical protein